MTLLEIGRVIKPHGLRGELRVRLHWAESDALSRVEHVILTLPGAAPRGWAVEVVRRSPLGVLLKVAGIEDRTAAETLRGATVSLPRESLVPLEPGEYYLADLVGFSVVISDVPLGEVVEVRTHPTVDSIVIRTLAGTQVEQALAAPWLEEVDSERRLVVLSSSDGLIE